MLYKIFKTINNHYYLYDTLSNNIAEIDKISAEIIESEDFIEKLYNDSLLQIIKPSKHLDKSVKKSITGIRKLYDSKNFFQKIKFKNIEYPISKVKYKEKLSSKISSYTIEITRKCNFRCEYCIYGKHYKKTRDHENITISIKVLNKIVNFIIQHSKGEKEIKVGFFGGEPLLAIKEIKYIINKIEPYFKKIFWRMTTNGSLLNEKVIDFLYKKKIRLIISLDGPQEIHDRYRVDVFGKPTYNIIIDNLIMLKKKYPYYFGTCSFSSVSAPPFKTEEINKYFLNNDIVKNNNFEIGYLNTAENVFFQKFSHLENVKGIIDLWNEHDSLTKLIIKKDLEMIRGNSFFRAYKEDILRIFTRKKIETPTNTNSIFLNGMCMPMAPKLFINIDGEFSCCEKTSDLNYNLGNIYNDFKIDCAYDLLEDYKKNCSNCKTCWLARLCSICIASCIDGEKLSKKAKEEYCQITKKLYAKIFKIYLLLLEENFSCNDLLK